MSDVQSRFPGATGHAHGPRARRLAVVAVVCGLTLTGALARAGEPADTAPPSVTFAADGTPGALTRDRTPEFSGQAGNDLTDDTTVRLRFFHGADATGTEVDMDSALAGTQPLEVERAAD